MGDITSACYNASTKTSQFQNISSLNINHKIIERQTPFDPLSNYISPHEDIMETLKKASKYRINHKQINQQQIQSQQQLHKLWAIRVKHQNRQAQYIYVRGGTPDQPLDGQIMIQFPNGQIFQGTMQKDTPIQGIFIFKAGQYYVGSIKDFNAEGNGRYQDSKSGYVYQGSWSKSLAHGKGKETFGNGDQYEGEIMYGAKFGHGFYAYSDKKKYQGSFYNNVSDGHGKMSYADGSQYDGDWKLGLFHGQGKFTWPNGETYEGQYCQGVREGKGKYIFKNNRFYDGNWKNGVQQGEGVFSQGFDEISGIWEEGQLCT